MSISADLIAQAIDRLAFVSGVRMDPDALAEDAFLLSVTFPDEHDFLAAVLATERALRHLAAGRVTSSRLERDRAGWMSYHYQHRVAQGQQADCRIEWQARDGAVYVRGFGHRWRPVDFYARMARLRKER